MHRLFSNKKLLLVVAALVVIVSVFTFSTHKKAIDYSADVKPILNKKCITCHGGVRRKAGFSVLFRSDALAKAESGKFAIIPGDPDHSELVKRITAKDPEDRMPYKHEPLSANEVSILKRWIKEGAQWGDHWAYVAVKPTKVPKPKGSFFGLMPAAKTDWMKNEIDYFIYDKLQQEKLQPSAEADKATLLRRVSLDLTGMPASEKLTEKFLQSKNANDYEVLVDSLLASPHFGEHWAAMWLDLARYADTKGYERDDSREIWRYRDWLIHAFNNDEPYDQFITDQIAGDLLPNPTDAEYIATAFHRNTMTNDEGGTDNEEFRTAAVLDRVNTTWAALMGTTFSCVQCHSHPYDPFRHDEYYKFVAFFNNTRDEDTYADYPLLVHFVKEDSIRLGKLQAWISSNASQQRSEEIYQFVKTGQPSINSLQADHFVNSELNDTKWLIFRNHAVSRLPHVDLTGKNRLIYRFMSFEKGGEWTLHLDAPGGPVLTKVVHGNTKGKWTIAQASIPRTAGEHAVYFTYENPYLKKSGDNGMMFDWFHFTEEFPGKGKPGYDSAQSAFWKLMNTNAETTPIMMENPLSMKRKSFVFERGNWLVKGKEVQPGTPHSLLPFPADMPANRLGLARWITSKEHPLTARTLVNRMWEQLFGTGLAETLEDLGTQGVPPTHPQLLDYLAWRFMNGDHWNIKSLLKTMVMSATYRQDSRISDVLSEKDPNNKYYARGPRVRLSAEQVRDQTLAVSGLLSPTMYGPSVMPYQPKGIWASPYNELKWKLSKGEDSHRRAIYTYWKRTSWFRRSAF